MELTARGYAVLARRYRTRHGELDIVCEHEGTIVFVEVRARATAEFGRAAESITDAKKRKVSAMAADYLARTRDRESPVPFRRRGGGQRDGALAARSRCIRTRSTRPGIAAPANG